MCRLRSLLSLGHARSCDGYDEPIAAYLARVVFEVTDEATTGALTQKVADTLPDDIRRLVTAGSSGGV